LHEVGGQQGTAKLQLAPGWEARLCGLDGIVEAKIAPVRRLSFRPYEIVSVRIARSRKTSPRQR
jgi:hypothetical protein